MLIVMKKDATAADVKKVKDTIASMGYKPVAMPGAGRTAIGVLGNTGYVDEGPFRDLSGIRDMIHVTKPYKLVSRDFHPHDTKVNIGRGIKIGQGCPPLIIAGPCAIESEEQMLSTARFLKRIGMNAIRGGAYKPRTSPHSFQGMREEGVRILSKVKKATGLLTVTEVMSPDQVEFVAKHVDILQIGTRNMQNFDLLKQVGKCKNPVILKRGLSATVEEWIASAEYIMVGGNSKIILCERGIRTFDNSTRNTADLAIIPLVKTLTHLPIIFDPSHATGKRMLVAPTSLAALAVGAHGLMIEVHPDPSKATSDGPQSLDFKEFGALNKKLTAMSAFMKKLGR